MTIWTPDLSRRKGALYLALADAIAAGVEEGVLEEGARLPPQRELAFRLKVTVGTVSRAYGLAEERGLVSAEVGRGTFVSLPRRRPERPLARAAVSAPVIDLTVNQPADRSYQEALTPALAELAGRGAALADLMPYAPRGGLERHRSAGAAWLGRSGLEADPARLILTGGAHQAIFAALATLARPGDVMLAESLSYTGLRAIAAAFHLRIEGVGMDEQGMRPDALDAACRASGARVLFTNPTLHNPSGTTQPAERRERIAALARKHDLTIVEDDVYGLLRRDRPPPFAQLASERTVHVSGTAKTLAPGLRLGLLSSPAALHERLANATYDLFLAQPALTAEVFALWLADGTADRLLERQRAEILARQRLAAEVLGPGAYAADASSPHLWLPLPPPWRAGDFRLAALERGVAVASGQDFAVGRSHAPHPVRVSLCTPDREQLRHALTVIRSIMAETPGPRRGII